ncbi:TIM barrel protein [Actinoplanes sp. NPDC051470]|uniref:sugar phosphate isomerase/epimerase family protein n=1 Tax=unclassified Actinoplanes TaxID=2626549 RepID=UPI0034127F27
MTSTATRRIQSHVRAELDATTWPVATGTLPFPPSADHADRARRLRQVARAGFVLVELTDTWLRVGDLPGDEVDQLGEAAAAAKLEIAAVAVIRGSVVDPRHGDANLAYSHRTIDAAARLGARVVSVGLHEPLTAAQREQLWFWTADHPANDPADTELRGRAVARLRDLGSHAAAAGLLLSLEMYEDTFLGTAESAVRMVEDIGLPEVGLNPDTGNLVRLHRPVEPPREVLEKVLPYTNYWHVKNYLRMDDPDRGVVLTSPTSLELGVIDYRQALGTALASGFSGVVTCEQYGGDALGVSAVNHAYVRGLLHSHLDEERNNP